MPCSCSSNADYGLNAVHGVQSRCGSKNDSEGNIIANCPTSFPSPNALGCAFNETLWRAMTDVIGHEMRSLWLQGIGENHGNGLPHIGLNTWSPNINVCRDPRWGRCQEVPGESSYVNGRYGVQYSHGLQIGSDDRYYRGVTCLKHWAAYSLESYGSHTRHNFVANVSDYMLQTVYLPAFKAGITEGNAQSVMCSYNAIALQVGDNSTEFGPGVPTCASKTLAHILREEWGFTGEPTAIQRPNAPFSALEPKPPVPDPCP